HSVLSTTARNGLERGPKLRTGFRVFERVFSQRLHYFFNDGRPIVFCARHLRVGEYLAVLLMANDGLNLVSALIELCVKYSLDGQLGATSYGRISILPFQFRQCNSGWGLGRRRARKFGCVTVALASADVEDGRGNGRRNDFLCRVFGSCLWTYVRPPSRFMI